MAKVSGPDFPAGIAATTLREGQPLLGHVGKDPVLLTRLGAEFTAVGAVCAHYHGPLDQGLVVAAGRILWPNRRAGSHPATSPPPHAVPDQVC